MIYRIEPKIFDLYPNFCRGVVVASKIDNTAMACPMLERQLRERIKEIEGDDSISITHPRISAWSAVYKTFSIRDATKIRPSIAALVKRIRNGKGSQIPFISPLVCASNLVSLKFLVPSGLIDAERVSGDLILGYAQGDEAFEPIGGDTVTSPESGEIIYYDGDSRVVMCRAWNSRGGKATLIRPTTTTAVIDVDGLLDVISLAELELATAFVANLVKEFCKAETSIYFLGANTQTLHIG